MEIEPVTETMYIASHSGASFQFNVEKGSAWEDVVAAAKRKLRFLSLIILDDGETYDTIGGSVVAIAPGSWTPDCDDPKPADCELVPVSELVRFWIENRR